MSKKDDFLGGIFDFNGDGKTDLGEEFLAFKIFEEVTKENSENNNSYHLGFTPRHTKYRLIKRPTKPLPSMQPIPEHLSLKEYKDRRKAFVGEVFLSILLAFFLCSIPGDVVWAAISAYDAQNSASGVVVTILVIAGLVIAGVVIYAAASSISESYKHLMKAKDVYLKGATEKDTIQKS